MKIYVDADACPVKEIIIFEAKIRDVEVTMIVDTSHEINDGYSEVIVVDKSADSADIKIANLINKGDIVVTQDFGVATMALGKGARAINQTGMIYTNDNIDTLLLSRHINRKLRNGGRKIKGPKKRTKCDDVLLVENLEKIIANNN